MGRFRKYKSYSFQDDNFNPDTQYQLAYKRVKKIKGFYVHAFVYALINAFLIIRCLNKSIEGNEEFLRWETFSTALFWGIGLASHGFSVFGKNLFFTDNWEERKIQELMDKDKNHKWE
jgi:hypothetical protein